MSSDVSWHIRDVVTNAEAQFNKSLRPRKPEGSLGRTAQDVHLDSHTAPELWWLDKSVVLLKYAPLIRGLETLDRPTRCASQTARDSVTDRGISLVVRSGPVRN